MKKIFTLLALLLATSLAINAQDNKCGENLTWSYENGGLTISGSGDMTDYSSSNQPWNSYMSNITSIVIENGVTSIGANAFYYCNKIPNITIPASVTTIGEDAFYNCTKLTSVTFADGSVLATIGNYAFAYCSSLESITIPASVTSIGDNAFSGCNGLTSITISEGVASIGGWAFQSCSKLTSIEIPASVTSIGTGAFNTCVKLETITVDDENPNYSDGNGSNGIFNKDVTKLVAGCKNTTIPEGVISIEEQAFSGSKNLSSIILPNSLKSIGNSAFTDCQGLTTIIIPESVTNIGNKAFILCKGITSIIIPASVTNIGNKAFQNCTNLKSVTCLATDVPQLGDGAFIYEDWPDVGTLPELNAIYVPSASLDAYKVADNWSTYYEKISALSETTFLFSATGDKDDVISSYTEKFTKANFTGAYADATISEVSDGDYKAVFYGDVTEIGNEALKGCTSLTSITIPASVTSIGTEVLSGCNALETITVDDENPNYSDGSGKNGIFNKGVTTLVAGCKTTVIPNSVTSIATKAFAGCTGLTTVIIPASVESLGDNVFSNCGTLSAFFLRESITTIGSKIFDGCTSWGIYVPTNSLDAYKSAGCWESNKYYINPGGLCGKNGDNLIWTLKSYKVNISGTGDMADYNSNNKAPWYGNNIYYISISKGVTNIGNYAFYNCSDLTSVEFEETSQVTNIGNYAFDGCSAIASITIPASVTSIGDHAFYNWNNLRSINIPESVTSIGDLAFYDCFSLDEIKVDSKNAVFSDGDNSNCLINKITNSLLLGCKNTIIPNNVTSIEQCAFYDCPKLTSITIPNSVKSIGDNAFSKCLYLVTVYSLATSVPSLGNNAFSDCSELANIYVPAGSVDKYKTEDGEISKGWYTYKKKIFAGGYCDENLTWSFANGTLTISGTGAMPDYDNNTKKAPWFEDENIRSSITSVVIGTEVTSIGNWAFYDCKQIQNIAIPASVTSIGKNAFKGCEGLESVSFADGSLLTSIEEKAFMECDALVSVTIPASVTSIGEYAFNDCDALTSVTFADGSQLETIGSYAFSTCLLLASLTIPESVTSIGDNAFSGCNGLTSITIPASVTSIGESAFDNCTGLTTVTIGKSVNSIGTGAFNGCIKLETITIDSENLNYSNGNGNNGLFNKDATTLIIGCKNTTIPEGVTSIGENAFSSCTSLTSITIPSSVTSIGENAFSSCTSLATITVKATTPPTLSNTAFSGCTLNNIFVPAGSYEAYTNENEAISNGWYTYKANVSNGTCGNDVVWTLSGESDDYTLNIFGSGAMTDYNIIDKHPDWYTYIESITSVVIRDGVTSIGNATFIGCSALTSVTIPEGVTSIGSAAFDATGLTSITIPASVTSIGNLAFSACKNLSSVICLATDVPTLGSNAFTSCHKDLTIYVPVGTADTYQKKDGWSTYADKIIDNANVSIRESGLCTFSSNWDTVIPEDVAAFYVTGVNEDKVSLTLIESGKIPANTGVVLRGTPNSEITLPYTTGATPIVGNMLIAVSSQINGLEPEVTDGEKTYQNYVFSAGQFHPFTNGATINIAAGKAYLQIEKQVNAKDLTLVFEGETTGVSHVENAENVENVGNIYNLAGQIVDENYKGIVIINGQKFLNK